MNALIVALLVSGAFTYILSRKINNHVATPKLTFVKYAAVSKDLTAGVVLKAEDLKLVDWPGTDAMPGTFSRMEDVTGRVLLYPVSAGQLLTDKLLSAAGSGYGLAGKIPDGKRAIALRSDEVVGVAGFLMPGSHVDVLVTLHANGSSEPMTTTVLQDAEVIASGHQITPDPEGKPTTTTVVTLLLTPQEAERAVLATTQGSVHFVLRNGSDQGQIHSSPTMLSQLSGGGTPVPHSTPQAAPRSRPTPIRADDTVEIILGDKVATMAGDGGAKP